MEKKITLKDQVKARIETAWKWRGTVSDILLWVNNADAMNPILASIDTVRKAVNELTDEGKLVWDMDDPKIRAKFYRIAKEETRIEEEITLKDQVKNAISEAQFNEGLTVKEIMELVKVKASIDTYRKAVEELLELNELEIYFQDKKVTTYRTRQTIEQEEAEYEEQQRALLESRKEIEREVERTRFDKGWKLRTVRLVLQAEKEVARHELAEIIGSDIKNTHMMVMFLKNGQTKYPALDVEYNKKTRSYIVKD